MYLKLLIGTENPGRVGESHGVHEFAGAACITHSPLAGSSLLTSPRGRLLRLMEFSCFPRALFCYLQAPSQVACASGGGSCPCCSCPGMVMTLLSVSASRECRHPTAPSKDLCPPHRAPGCLQILPLAVNCEIPRAGEGGGKSNKQMSLCILTVTFLLFGISLLQILISNVNVTVIPGR